MGSGLPSIGNGKTEAEPYWGEEGVMGRGRRVPDMFKGQETCVAGTK